MMMDVEKWLLSPKKNSVREKTYDSPMLKILGREKNGVLNKKLPANRPFRIDRPKHRWMVVRSVGRISRSIAKRSMEREIDRAIVDRSID